MPRRKRPVRSRAAFAGPGRVVVRCDCGHRLGERWPLPDDHTRTVPTTGQVVVAASGPWYVPTLRGTYIDGEEPGRSGAMHGLKDIAFDDWLSVTCTACARVWQGREWQVDDLVFEASSAGRSNVTISDATGRQPRRPPRPALETTRRW